MGNLFRTVRTAAVFACPLALGHVGVGHAQGVESFAIISGQSITNTGATTVVGNIALSPGNTFTGFGTITQTGATFVADAIAQRVQDDLSTVYQTLAGRPTTVDLTGQNLGGLVLTPGVYNFDTSANLATGQTLTLDAGGDTSAIFIFNIGSTLTAGSSSQMALVNGAQGGNVFFRVGSSATLDTSSSLEGQIVALTSISMNNAASLNCGAAYARNGSVTLIANTIQICTLAATGMDAVLALPGLTEEERALAVAWSAYVAGGGTLPLGFSVLPATMTPTELAASLAQLSGQVSTGVAPTTMQAMDDFMDTVLRSAPGRPGYVSLLPRPEQSPVGLVWRDAVATGKYGEMVAPQPSPVTTGGYDVSLTQTRGWDLWLSGYGSRRLTYGDARLGHRERTSSNIGIAAGLDFMPSANTLFGIAVSLNSADFALNNGFGTGSSNGIFAALRGRTSSDLGYVEGMLAFGRSTISTDRTVTIAGTDRFLGETTASTIAAHVEAGYRLGAFTPFVGLRGQSFSTPAYAERTVAGSSSYALQYDAYTATSLRSEVGVDWRWSAPATEYSTMSFGLRAAYAHEFATNAPGTRSFVAVPGISFPASGATRDRDFVTLAASASVIGRNGFFADFAIRTEISNNSQDYGGSITVGYTW